MTGTTSLAAFTTPMSRPFHLFAGQAERVEQRERWGPFKTEGHFWLRIVCFLSKVAVLGRPVASVLKKRERLVAVFVPQSPVMVMPEVFGEFLSGKSSMAPGKRPPCACMK